MFHTGEGKIVFLILFGFLERVRAPQLIAEANYLLDFADIGGESVCVFPPVLGSYYVHMLWIRFRGEEMGRL